jgi:hypothetical protein
VSPSSPAEDARDFCAHLLHIAPKEVSAREQHRAEFANGGARFAMRLVPAQWALQFLFRRGRDTREWLLRFG